MRCGELWAAFKGTSFKHEATPLTAMIGSLFAIGGLQVLQSLVQPGCVNADFSVDSTRGLAVPTQESWDAAFADCFGEAGEGVCAYKPEDLPAAIESPATSMRKAQQAEQEGKENTADGSTAVAEDRGFKLGASSREDELMRKQVIGHIIPVAVAVGLFIGGKPLIPEL